MLTRRMRSTGSIAREVFKMALYSKEEMEIEFYKAVAYKEEGKFEEAFAIFQQLAEQGDAVSQCNLGICYLNNRSVNKNYGKAIKWFRKAADQKHAGAMYILGCIYSEGKYGIKKDPVQAVEWFFKAAEQGHAAAHVELGCMYSEGKGVEKNDEKAVEWFRKAEKLRDDNEEDARPLEAYKEFDNDNYVGLI